MSQPFKLFRLQQIDSQIDRIHGRLAEIKALLSEDNAIRQAHQALETARKNLLETERKLKRAEQDVQAQRIKIEQTEASLYGGKIRSPKELQDLQHESVALKRFLATLEDRQIEAMLNQETGEAEHQQTVEALSAAQKHFELQNIDLAQEQKHLLRDLVGLEQDRRAASENLPEQDLQLYDQIRKVRRGVAVAKVSDKACSACGTTLNATLLQASRNPTQLVRCSNCARILYSL